MCPRLRRVLRLASHRSVPRRTGLALVLLEARRRLRPRGLFAMPLGPGSVMLSESDFEVDWAALEWVLGTDSYATDYTEAVVVDLGAHKGYFSAYAVAAGARVVLAYEPESRNFELLERCAASYGGHARWLLRHAAVSDRPGVAELHVTQASWSHALNLTGQLAPYEVGVEHVRVAAMEDVLVEATALAEGWRPLVVKINTEGEECAIVLGTPSPLWRHVDEVFVEVHSWAPCTAEELARHLAAAGLRQVTSADPHILRLRRG